MKALFFSAKGLFLCLLTVMAAALLSCAPAKPAQRESSAEDSSTEVWEEAEPGFVEFAVYDADAESSMELFYPVGESEHAIAYVSGHGISETAAMELLSGFESSVFPRLPFLSAEDGRKICILLTYLPGQTYGYALFPEPEQGLTVCLNAVYPRALAYALAHEYQHLCAYRACRAGETVLSEATDELLSDVFCETIYPDEGNSLGILSEQRAKAAREKLEAWGPDALLHVYDLLRKGYAEDELLLMMENR